MVRGSGRSGSSCRTFFLLLKVGHEATKDPNLQGFLIVTFVQRYDIAMRSHFHHVVSNRQAQAFSCLTRAKRALA